jgi:TRAP-type uncharacterized transport system fused permease subunit
MVLAFAGFLVPFMFVYGPPLLLMGSPGEIILGVMTGTAGVTALAAATMGYMRRELRWWERSLLGLAAGALIFPNLATDAFGLMILLFIFSRSGSMIPIPGR